MDPLTGTPHHALYHALYDEPCLHVLQLYQGGMMGNSPTIQLHMFPHRITL